MDRMIRGVVRLPSGERLRRFVRSARSIAFERFGNGRHAGDATKRVRGTTLVAAMLSRTRTASATSARCREVEPRGDGLASALLAG
jgi:hypothetical protein